MADARKTRLDKLERQLVGARKVGVFGHRNVGKTTLLSMFYREASNGKIPNLRLSAPDAATAAYLAEKIARIEAGEPPAGTLSETELKLRLYHGQARYDLIIKDYQGEHITLGSGEPILEFFQDCDAVMFCLDPEGSTDPADRRQRQQEVENLLERYIEQSAEARVERPIALLVTKYDQVLNKNGPTTVAALLEERYGMTLHAVTQHATRSAVFAVSSYGSEGGLDGRPPSADHLRPMGLDAPLLWVAEQLEVIDREQLEWIWDLAPRDVGRLKRCVTAFERRYPRSPKVDQYWRQWSALRRRRMFQNTAKLGGALALAVGGLAAYDFQGVRNAVQFEENHPPAAVSARWEEVLQWHPTLRWFWPSQYRIAEDKLTEWKIKADALRIAQGRIDPLLDEKLATLLDQAPERSEDIAKVRFAADQLRHDQRWKTIRADMDIPDSDPTEQLEKVKTFMREFPDSMHREEALEFASRLTDQVKLSRSRLERQKVDELIRSAALPNADLPDLIDKAEKYLKQFPESHYRAEVETLVDNFAQTLDERDYLKTTDYGRRYPTNFAIRLEKLDNYLQTHKAAGKYLAQARESKAQVMSEWDNHVYKTAYDHYVAHPNDLEEVARRLRDYLRDHPDGRYIGDAQAYIDWFAKVSAPGEYRVTLRRGSVEPSVGKSFAGGAPDLGVVLEVGGVTYGPSPVIPNTHNPIWGYTFSNPIKWKMGDKVVIKIIDYDWTDSTVFTFDSPEDDPLAMRYLSGKIKPAQGGTTMLDFSSDFLMPALPPPQPLQNPSNP